MEQTSEIWGYPAMLEEDQRDASVSRRCNQIKQLIKLQKCEHRDDAITFCVLMNGGYIEYCTDCMYILDINGD